MTNKFHKFIFLHYDGFFLRISQNSLYTWGRMRTFQIFKARDKTLTNYVLTKQVLNTEDEFWLLKFLVFYIYRCVDPGTHSVYVYNNACIDMHVLQKWQFTIDLFKKSWTWLHTSVSSKVHQRRSCSDFFNQPARFWIYKKESWLKLYNINFMVSLVASGYGIAGKTRVS